jgi:hypothetical protein
MNDALYDKFLSDPLEQNIEEIAEKEVVEVKVENDRVINVLKSRAEEYLKRSKLAEDKGANSTAEKYYATASELGYLAGMIERGKLEELEKKG